MVMARPEVIKTPLGQRLRDVRQALGDLSRDEFTQILGISSKTLANHERGDTQPDAAALAAYREHCGVDVNWLVTGKGGMFLQGADQAKNQLLPANDDFIALPFLDVLASAGHGAVAPIYEEVRTVISFERAFLRNLGATPDSCNIIAARGDSMVPTIPDGALIIVDHSQTEVVNGWISVLNVGGDLLVKRVRRRLDGNVELVSDNPLYPVEVIGADRIDQLTIIGRVVYFCRAP